jgi:ribosomal protein S18 acetylase RimI-like enzyme
LTSVPNSPTTGVPSANHALVRASQYTYDQLADIYNQARVDYIVPMPMNGKRMKAYIDHYDLDLALSFVALNDNALETGIAMLGVRDDRTWITRLGVIPERRGYKVGQHLTEALIEESHQRGSKRVQLEVIVGNDPAYRLFSKLGFEPVRELLVIRRPPGAMAEATLPDGVTIRPIIADEFQPLLNTRSDVPSWLDETPSLINAGDLRGVLVEHRDAAPSWVIFQPSPYQLSYFAFSPNADADMLRLALSRIYQEFSRQDTKIENLPSDSPIWPVLQSVGFIEGFRRTEMYLDF